MKYTLIAVSDSDAMWNDRMDAWWNNGGALLWNQHGGFGTDSLVLNNDQVDAFLEKAKLIEGWNAVPGSPEWGEMVNPVIVQQHTEADPVSDDNSGETRSAPPGSCCSSCGRPVHEALHTVWECGMIAVPRTEMNHVLNSLQEAIEFCQGTGPNNFKTWEAALSEFVAALAGSASGR